MDFIQFLGYIGVGLNLLICQQKTRKRVLFNKITSNGVWAIHYFLLNAYSAMAIACLGMISTSVFMKVNPKSKAGKIWLLVFITISIVSGILTSGMLKSGTFSWSMVISFLPVFASVVSNISFFVGVPKYTRRFALVISACMGTYSYFNGSMPGVINEILTVISSITGMIRMDFKKEKKHEV